MRSKLRRILFVTSQNPWPPANSEQYASLALITALTKLPAAVRIFCHGRLSDVPQLGPLQVEEFHQLGPGKVLSLPHLVDVFEPASDWIVLKGLVDKWDPHLIVVDGFASHLWLFEMPGRLLSRSVYYSSMTPGMRIRAWAAYTHNFSDRDTHETFIDAVWVAHQEAQIAKFLPRALVLSETDKFYWERLGLRQVQTFLPCLSVDKVNPTHGGPLFCRRGFMPQLNSHVAKAVQMLGPELVTTDFSQLSRCRGAYIPADGPGLSLYTLACMKAGLPVAAPNSTARSFRLGGAGLIMPLLEQLLHLSEQELINLSELSKEYTEEYYSPESALLSLRSALDGML